MELDLSYIMRQGAFAVLAGVFIYTTIRLYADNKSLYDRLITSKEKETEDSKEWLEKVVVEITKTRIVLERLVNKRNGGSNGTDTRSDNGGAP